MVVSVLQVAEMLDHGSEGQSHTYMPQFAKAIMAALVLFLLKSHHKHAINTPLPPLLG